MRYLSFFFLAFTTGVLLSYCVPNDYTKTSDSSPISPQTTDDPVIITFAAQASERHIYEPFIDAFNTENPNIDVRFVALGADQSILQVVHAADTSVVSLVHPSDVEKGYLQDLTPFIYADPKFDHTDFFSRTLQTTTKNDKIYLIPHIFQAELLLYNEYLWGQAGLLEPELDWIWDDLLNAASQLSNQGNDITPVYGLFDETGGVRTLVNEVAAVDKDLFTSPLGQVQLDTPTTVEAIERVVSLMESGVIYVDLSVGDDTVDKDTVVQMIVDQQIGIWPAHLTLHSNVDLPFPTGAAVLPLLFSSPFAHNGGYIMSSGTRYPTEAWQWLSFLSHQINPSLYLKSGNVLSVPARRSIAEQNDHYWKRFDSETTSVIKAILDKPASPLLDNPDPAIINALHQAFIAVVNDKQSIVQALREEEMVLEEQSQRIMQTTIPSKPVVVSTPLPLNIPPDGATTITFMSNIGPITDRFWQIADSFNQRQQNIFVQIKPPDSSDLSELTDLAAKADCFAWYIPPNQVDLPAILDLRPLIDADAAFDLDDYPPALLEPFQFKGGVYGLPYMVTFRVLVYNETMFDDANLAYPDIQWTLDDFLSTVQQLTTNDGKQYGFASVRSMKSDLVFFLDQFGASAVKQSSDGPQPNFTDPKVVQAIQFYVDLLLNYSPHRRFWGYAQTGVPNNGAQLALEGRIGMWLNFGTLMSSVYNNAGINTRTAPPPLGNKGVNTHDVEQNGLYIAANTQEPEACWTWLKYLSSDPTALQGMSPARTSVAESEEFINLISPDFAAIHQAYRETSARTSLNATPELFYSSGIEYYWLYRAIDRALQGKDIERELDNAQVLTRQHLACVRSGGQPHSCALEVDPQYDGYLSAPS